MSPTTRIDISLTAISSRLGRLGAVLRSLLDQDHPAGAVHLHLSHDAYLMDQGVAALPEDIAALQAASGGRLQVHFVRNTGPYRKLLPYLYRHWGRARLVATADDDTIYPRDWLSRLLAAHERYGCVTAWRGHRIALREGRIQPYRSWMRARIEENPGRLILPTGKDGILYDTAFFPIGVLNAGDAMKIAPTADDLWLRWHLAMNGIPVCLLEAGSRAGRFAETGAGDGLYASYNRGGSNDAAVAALENYFQAKYRFSLAAQQA